MPLVVSKSRPAIAGIHIFGDHQAILLERLDHFRAAHRRGVALDESLAEEIDILAVDDDFECGRVGPILAEMPEADDLGGDRLVAIRVELGPGLGQSGDAGLGHRLGGAPDPVDAVNVHRRRDPMAGRLHHGQKFGRDDLLPALFLRLRVEVGGHAGRVPFGDFRALELHGGRRVAGDDVGAKLGERIGRVAGDRGLLPFAAGGGEHFAELGDGGGVRAAVPLMQHIGLGLGERRRRPSAQGSTDADDRRHISTIAHDFLPVFAPALLSSV